MSFFDPQARERYERFERQLEGLLDEYKQWRKVPPEQPEHAFDALRQTWDFLRWRRDEEEQARRSAFIEHRLDEMFREHIAQHIPPDIREAIRQLRAAGYLEPAQEPVQINGIILALREAFADIGFLIIFLVFVLFGSIYLGERPMFYILSLILLSIIVVNAHKLRRMIELLPGF